MRQIFFLFLNCGYRLLKYSSVSGVEVTNPFVTWKFIQRGSFCLRPSGKNSVTVAAASFKLFLFIGLLVSAQRDMGSSICRSSDSVKFVPCVLLDYTDFVLCLIKSISRYCSSLLHEYIYIDSCRTFSSSGSMLRSRFLRALVARIEALETDN